MLVTRSELLKKISFGEDSFLELKEGRSAGKVRGNTQDDLAAFANSAGGVLVLGAEDKSPAGIGIDPDKFGGVETALREASVQSIRPSLAPVIERLTLPDMGGVEQPVMPCSGARPGRLV